MPSPAQYAATKASFVVAHKIAQSNKTFTEGEFLKDCMIVVADILCPESAKKFQSILLSRRSVVRRIEAISEILRTNSVLKLNHSNGTHWHWAKH